MSDNAYLTISKVVNKLKSRFPDLSVSKVRYLEEEGLLTPSRTPGGYRHYSQADMQRLERILELQKEHFLPLAVIKDELERQENGEPARSSSTQASSLMPYVNPELIDRLHPIDRMPEIAHVPVSFVRQLSESGIVKLKKSPAGRDMVDGKDLGLIRLADKVRRYGIEPKNLRQYVIAANRESAMFEQALAVHVKRAEAGDNEAAQELRDAFQDILLVTGAIHDELLKRVVRTAYTELGE